MTKQQKLEKLAEAANAMRTAKIALIQICIDDAKDDNCNGQYIKGDATYLNNQVDYLLRGDDGEGGLDQLVRIVEAELS